MKKLILAVLILGSVGCSVNSLESQAPIYSGHTQKDADAMNRCLAPKWVELRSSSSSIPTETGYKITASDDIFGALSIATIDKSSSGGSDIKVLRWLKDGMTTGQQQRVRVCSIFKLKSHLRVAFLLGAFMTEVMTKIELGGVLGKTFGKTHYRLIRTTAEATNALSRTLKGFEKYLNTSRARGLTYAVFKGKKNINVDDLSFPVCGEVIRIVPIIIGSKKAGLLQTILGAVLVVAGVAVGYMSAGTLSVAGYGVAKVGAAMMLGGIVQMLSPQPAGLASKQDADNQASYAFGGVTNTAAQGNPVPLGYGRRRIGGAIISAGIYVEDKQ